MSPISAVGTKQNSLAKFPERAALFHSSSPDSFFLLLNTKGGNTNSKGSKKNPAFALTLKTIKQQ